MKRHQTVLIDAVKKLSSSISTLNKVWKRHKKTNNKKQANLSRTRILFEVEQ